MNRKWLYDNVKQMPYYVYILECSNKALYTGITTDLERRLKEHQTGKGCHYTKYNPGIKIRYFEEHPNRSSATKREAEIKKWSRAKKLTFHLWLGWGTLITTGKSGKRRCSPGRKIGG